MNRPIAPPIEGFVQTGFLGSGGFADVFAYQHRAGAAYAVKVWRTTVDSEALEKLTTEAEALGRLAGSGTHPNIVMVNPPLLVNGKPYLIMELCPGGSLAGKGPMPVADVLRIGIQMCGALETSHLHDVLHCDVKPGNILLTRDGTAKLSDFGIAEPATVRGPGGDMLTPQYAAPEIDTLGETSPLSDVYALAATLYELLTGVPPFRVAHGDNSREAIERRKRADEIPPIGRSEVPPDLERLLRFALRCDIKERGRGFGSDGGRGPAAVFGTELRRIAASRRDEQTAMVVFPPSAGAPVHFEPATRAKPDQSPASPPAPASPSATLSGTRPGSRVPAPSAPVSVPKTMARIDPARSVRLNAPPRRPWLRIALVAACACVLAVAVIGIVTGVGTGSDHQPGPAVTTPPPTDPNPLALVPTPHVTAHRFATGSVTFTWTYSPITSGDTYRVTRTDAATVTPVWVSVRSWTVKNAADERPCVEIIVVRTNGRASDTPGRACATPVAR